MRWSSDDSDQPQGTTRDALNRFVFGDPRSVPDTRPSGRTWRNTPRCCRQTRTARRTRRTRSVPRPFDNTCSPEHDAFVLKVKMPAQRQVLHREHGRRRGPRALNQAWNDLFGVRITTRISACSRTIPPGAKSRKVADLDAAQMPQPAAARPYLTALRAHYDDVMRAQTLAQPGHVTDVLTFASRPGAGR